MPKRKNIKSKAKKTRENKDNGLTKIAAITTKSLSNAFVKFKKNQEIKKN